MPVGRTAPPGVCPCVSPPACPSSSSARRPGAVCRRPGRRRAAHHGRPHRQSAVQARTPVTISVTLANPAGGPAVSGVAGLSCQHLDSPVKSPGAPTRFRLAAGASRTLTFRWHRRQRTSRGTWSRRGRATRPAASWTPGGPPWTSPPPGSRFLRYGYSDRPSPAGRAASSPGASSGSSPRLPPERPPVLRLAGQASNAAGRHRRPPAGLLARHRHTGRHPRQTCWTSSGGHAAGMAALNYNLLYGAWSGYERDGVDSRGGLYTAPGRQEQDSLPMPAGWMTPGHLPL